MANKTLFRSFAGRLLRKTDTLNAEAAPAYSLDPKHALAQYAATGCLNTTFYATGEEQLDRVLELCEKVEAECRCDYISFRRKTVSQHLLSAGLPTVVPRVFTRDRHL